MADPCSEASRAKVLGSPFCWLKSWGFITNRSNEKRRFNNLRRIPSITSILFKDPSYNTRISKSLVLWAFPLTRDPNWMTLWGWKLVSTTGCSDGCSSRQTTANMLLSFDWGCGKTASAFLVRAKGLCGTLLVIGADFRWTVPKIFPAIAAEDTIMLLTSKISTFVVAELAVAR